MYIKLQRKVRDNRSWQGYPLSFSLKKKNRKKKQVKSSPANWPAAQNLSGFPQHKVTMSIIATLLTPGWHFSPLQVLSPPSPLALSSFPGRSATSLVERVLSEYRIFPKTTTQWPSPKIKCCGNLPTSPPTSQW